MAVAMLVAELHLMAVPFCNLDRLDLAVRWDRQDCQMIMSQGTPG